MSDRTNTALGRCQHGLAHSCRECRILVLESANAALEQHLTEATNRAESAERGYRIATTEFQEQMAEAKSTIASLKPFEYQVGASALKAVTEERDSLREQLRAAEDTITGLRELLSGTTAALAEANRQRDEKGAKENDGTP